MPFHVLGGLLGIFFAVLGMHEPIPDLCVPSLLVRAPRIKRQHPVHFEKEQVNPSLKRTLVRLVQSGKGESAVAGQERRDGVGRLHRNAIHTSRRRDHRSNSLRIERSVEARCEVNRIKHRATHTDRSEADLRETGSSGKSVGDFGLG